jgi:glutamine synthetase
MEKHDAFFELEYVYEGTQSFRKVERFDGRVLLKGEGDGSSFPNGGLRATQEARGYIAWDPYSDVFVREGINKTLYLPAMLLTHTGEALDEKTYLRRAESKLKLETIKLLNLLGETNVKSILFGLGIEQ